MPLAENEVEVETGIVKVPAPLYGANTVVLVPREPLLESLNPPTVRVSPPLNVRVPVVNDVWNAGLTIPKPLRAPTLRLDVVVPEPLCVELLWFCSVIMPVMPPLTVISMLNSGSARLYCGQSMAADASSVGPLTVLQLTIKVPAGATPLYNAIGNSAKKSRRAVFKEIPRRAHAIWLCLLYSDPLRPPTLRRAMA